MTGTEQEDDRDAARLFEDHVEFGDGTSVHVVAWDVPESHAYPDGVHYRFHFGSPEGTIIRYDNAHAGRHERHNPDGSVDDVEFTDVGNHYLRFRDEVAGWRREVRE